ncbi:MAG: hypothetical protein JSS02_07440, partial [Planctomycetes bacterium]|nr:hypothetical protein [Planctomycetota bacterium]
MLRFVCRLGFQVWLIAAAGSLFLVLYGCSHESDRGDLARERGAQGGHSAPLSKPADTADAAVLAALRGLSENRPDAVWEALPASYQQDLDGVVSSVVQRLHPEAIRWFSQIAAKSRELLPPDSDETRFVVPATRLLDWLASGRPGDLEQ